jgi:hypothetical protein
MKPIINFPLNPCGNAAYTKLHGLCHRLRFIAGCLGCLLLAFFSPTFSSAEEAEPVEVSFTFQTISFQSASGGLVTPGKTKLFYLNSGEYRTLSLGNNRLGLPHEFKGPLPFQVYREVVTEDDTIMVPIAQIDSARLNGSKHYILIVRNNQAKLALYPIAADANSIPEGNLLLLNGGTSRIIAKVGEQKPATIHVGRSALVRYDIDEDYRFALKIATNAEDEMKLISNTMITQTDSTASMVVLVYPVEQASYTRWIVRFLKLAR